MVTVTPDDDADDDSEDDDVKTCLIHQAPMELGTDRKPQRDRLYVPCGRQHRSGNVRHRLLMCP